MMIVMVATATMPAASSASMNHLESHETTATQSVTANDHADCDHHNVKISQNKKSKSEKSCCEEGVCKCVGGACNGLSKIFGNSDIDFLIHTESKSKFTLFGEPMLSALLERLKRPPKA